MRGWILKHCCVLKTFIKADQNASGCVVSYDFLKGAMGVKGQRSENCRNFEAQLN